MNNILKNFNPYFIIEVMPKSKLRNKTTRDIINYMKKYNYKIIKILDTENYIFKK
jgi:hypothetical protein